MSPSVSAYDSFLHIAPYIRMLTHHGLGHESTMLCMIYFAYQGYIQWNLHMLLHSGLITLVAAPITMSFIMHRYFSHRAFKTTRIFQFILGILSAFAYQGGPVWWGDIHRMHHKFSDRPGDPHSQTVDGFWLTMFFWYKPGVLTNSYYRTPKQFRDCPEMILLDMMSGVSIIFGTMYLVTTQWSFTHAFYYVYVPSIVGAINVIYFNVKYHPKDGAPDGECKATDFKYSKTAMFFGENLHKHHHSHPGLLKRPGIDFVYWLVAYPLLKLGVIWE